MGSNPTTSTSPRTRTGRAAGGSPADYMLAVRGARADGATLAATVADRIVRDIVDLGWPEGEVLGSEPELLERYGVSRAVFREAVRLVEHQEVARMRRGPGGGLVITTPTVEAVMDAVAVYLFHVGAGVDEVFETRLVLEEVVVALAPGRLGEAEIVALRELIARERGGDMGHYRDLHALLATFTQNPALEFFVDLLNRISMLFFADRGALDRETVGASAHAHSAIGEAVLAGDAGLARRRMRKHLQAEAAYLERISHTTIELPRLAEGQKRGQQVAFEILEGITTQAVEVGTLLGSESSLMERYDVSRAVLREAVRVLEHHQVAAMRRGPGGGLFVTEPGIGATTEAVALHLHRLAITPAQLFEVRSAVEVAVLERALAQMTDADVAAMEDALEAERSATILELGDVGHDLHAVVARISGNRVLELLTLVLLRLTRIHQTPRRTSKGGDALKADVVRAHGLIVEALAARDLELARLRMHKHLHALTDWVR